VNQSDGFRAGQRVRIRPSADSDFAGYDGVILYVGHDVCDVKIRYRPKGSKGYSTYIGTFKKEDLETSHRKFDLASFSNAQTLASQKRAMWVIITIIVVAAAWALWPH
jgi:hypothetical protein